MNKFKNIRPIIKKLILLFIISKYSNLVFPIDCICATDNTGKQEVISLTPEENTRPKFEEKYITPSHVKIITSQCGIKIFYRYDNSAPLVHINIAFKKSGSSYQKKEKSALPLLYSSAVFFGCGKYSTAQFEKELINIASNISCNYDQNILAFFMTAPTDVLDKAVNLLKEVINNPTFEKDKVKTLQYNSIAMMQNYAQFPEFFAKNIVIPSLIFKGHIYENGLCGAAENIATITVDDLKKYKHDYIVTSNAEICICGNISETKAISVVDQIFSNTAKGKPSPDTIQDTAPTITNITKKYYAEGPQSTIVFAMKAERILSQKRYAAAVLFRIFGGKALLKSRLMSTLRSKLGLIYSGNVRVIDLDHASYLIGILKTDNSKVEQAVTALRDIIKDLKENPITQQELDFAKSNIIGTQLVALRTSGDLCNFYFSAMLNGYGPNALNDMLNKIHNVSLDDVTKLSKEIFNENNIDIVIIGGNY